MIYIHKREIKQILREMKKVLREDHPQRDEGLKRKIEALEEVVGIKNLYKVRVTVDLYLLTEGEARAKDQAKQAIYDMDCIASVVSHPEPEEVLNIESLPLWVKGAVPRGSGGKSIKEMADEEGEL